MPPKIHIQGAGLAGQVLHRELGLRGIPSYLEDVRRFPREKVCGGILQRDSWEYLNSIFTIREKFISIDRMAHFWRGKKIAEQRLDPPMVSISRLTFDEALNSQQQPGEASGEEIRVIAWGVEKQRGEWIGFQTQGDAGAPRLEMHYGRGVYLGMAPAAENFSHIAFLAKKKLFKNQEDLRAKIRKELGLDLTGQWKGTGAIHYGYSRNELAVGDAKLATHPFLGLGMKHAILSARLMAELIEQNKIAEYDKRHRRFFRRFHWMSRTAAALYGSPFRFLLLPALQNRFLFSLIKKRLIGYSIP